MAPEDIGGGPPRAEIPTKRELELIEELEERKSLQEREIQNLCAKVQTLEDKRAAKAKVLATRGKTEAEEAARQKTAVDARAKAQAEEVVYTALVTKAVSRAAASARSVQRDLKSLLHISDQLGCDVCVGEDDQVDEAVAHCLNAFTTLGEQLNIPLSALGEHLDTSTAAGHQDEEDDDEEEELEVLEQQLCDWRQNKSQSAPGCFRTDSMQAFCATDVRTQSTVLRGDFESRLMKGDDQDEDDDCTTSPPSENIDELPKEVEGGLEPFELHSKAMERTSVIEKCEKQVADVEPPSPTSPKSRCSASSDTHSSVTSEDPTSPASPTNPQNPAVKRDCFSVTEDGQQLEPGQLQHQEPVDQTGVPSQMSVNTDADFQSPPDLTSPKIINKRRHSVQSQVSQANDFGDLNTRAKCKRRHSTQSMMSQMSVKTDTDLQDFIQRRSNSLHQRRRSSLMDRHSESYGSQLSAEQLVTALYSGNSGRKGTCTIIIEPTWTSRIIWDVVSMFIVMADAVWLPFELAYRMQASETPWFWFATAFFSLDVILNFMTAYEDPDRPGCMVRVRKLIAKRYLLSWCIIDVVSTVPWHLVVVYFASSGSDSVSSTRIAKVAKIVKLARFMRLARMLRLLHLEVIWDKFEEGIGSLLVLHLSSLLKVLVTMVLICHWNACIFWFVGQPDSLLNDASDEKGLHWTTVIRTREYVDPHTGMKRFVNYRWIDRPEQEVYPLCFYWTLGVMRTMPSEVYPVNATERIYVLMFMFFALASFAICITKITLTYSKLSRRRADFDEHMAEVRMYLRNHKVHTNLGEKIKGFLGTIFDRRRIMADEKKLLMHLNPSLHRELLYAMFGATLRQIMCFAEMPSLQIRALCALVKITDLAPGDILCRQGMVSNVGWILFQGELRRGELSFIKVNASRDETERLAAVLAYLKKQGEEIWVVDIECLLFDEPMLSEHSVTAVSYSELGTIAKGRFIEFRSNHPLFNAHILHVLRTTKFGFKCAERVQRNHEKMEEIRESTSFDNKPPLRQSAPDMPDERDVFGFALDFDKLEDAGDVGLESSRSPQSPTSPSSGQSPKSPSKPRRQSAEGSGLFGSRAGNSMVRAGAGSGGAGAAAVAVVNAVG